MPSGKTMGLGLVVLASSFVSTKATTYSLSQDLSGSKFFDGFKFNEIFWQKMGAKDPGSSSGNFLGNVHFLSQSAAQAANLTYVDSNGRVIIKVDNTTNGAGDSTFGRNSVYLESSELMNIGSLMIFDANHIPFGCSVWPSLFTQGQVWPQQGEIDLIEQVNLATDNRYSLHVGVDNCNQPTSVASNQTGTISTASGDLSNCTVTPTTGQNTVGCVTTETKSNSFGSGFASQGGGVYAMLWDTDGIAMWYFARGSVPSDIGTSNSPDPTTWGEASAWYPASGCNPSTAFGPQIITLYIDLCGAFAGQDSVFAQTCSSVAPNCSSMVTDPSNYANAYWEINYLRVFSNGQSNSSSSSTSASGTSSSSGSSSTGTSTSGSSNSAFTFAVTGIWEYLLVPASVTFLGVLSMI
ncbi:concanavalin A-like lectin/glucanase domain-containing protein [Lentinula aciculospora]|uniref:Concanavalin A-like lectin/glucanase domain-containing protein n=1 Tax=Lentinula aciculospora TaxID=153920 RepID=A0A9W9AHW6_9AGAR|nr:concanavalin A-like lectin/glucanase domain-containing protein [Lentinula aciculospora]